MDRFVAEALDHSTPVRRKPGWPWSKPWLGFPPPEFLPCGWMRWDVLGSTNSFPLLQAIRTARALQLARLDDGLAALARDP